MKRQYKTVRANITLSDFAQLVDERLKPLRDAGWFPDLNVPSNIELKSFWLPKIGLFVNSEDVIEFDVEVPPPRKAHAR